MRPPKMSDSEIAAELTQIPGWSLDSGKLHRAYVCKDFVDAFGKMTSVALCAEAMNHHPEWSNVWNRVSFHLSTHDAGGITKLDFELAAKVQKIFGA